MLKIIDNGLQLQPHKHYYRTKDVLELTGFTAEQLKAEMQAGRFPNYYPVELCIWDKKQIDLHIQNKKKEQ